LRSDQCEKTKYSVPEKVIGADGVRNQADAMLGIGDHCPGRFAAIVAAMPAAPLSGFFGEGLSQKLRLRFACHLLFTACVL
jgi:hypothetical protein